MDADKLLSELDSVIRGEPWYGSSVSKIVHSVDMVKVHDKSRGPHSIADILIHMVAWTEETTERLKGKFASDPFRGDWPDPSSYSWSQLQGMFTEANEHLRNTIVQMDNGMFTKDVNDDRYPELTEKITYSKLIEGMIQHHIYHSAQIAILNK